MFQCTVGRKLANSCPNRSNNFRQKLGKGLDDVHPFSDTTGVDIILREANNMLSPDLKAVGTRNAGRIWGLLSKFVILDRFSKTLGVAKVNPGCPVQRTISSDPSHFGTGEQVSISSQTALFSYATFSSWCY
jgi:hypothetical protein